ncbi:MAG: hypothetical protein RIT24_2454 [Planctomycetota bacterium]|jgi:hypothetical protein
MLSAALLGCFVSIAPVLQPIPSSLHPEAQSETNETLVLESSGLAATESEALQQALLSAVSSAVGTLIDAETIVENDKVIKDRILSASNGFVEKYEKLESHKTTDGWSVKIRATVRSGTLRERLDQSIHRATSPVDGQNLGQRIKTKKQVAQDQGQLIRLAIGDCHKGVLKIERIGDPEAVEAPGLPEDMVRLRIAVRISVDDKAWRVRMEKARQTLAVLAIAKASTEISLRQCQPPQELHDRHGSLRIEKERPGNVDGMVLDAPALASIDMNEVPMRRGRFLPESWHAAVE